MRASSRRCCSSRPTPSARRISPTRRAPPPTRSPPPWPSWTTAYAPGTRGLQLKRVAGGIALATDPVSEEAARRLLAKPRTPPLTPAQAETLAIVAYLQPVSRPEITRIRGVAAESATATLEERGFIEEGGRSQFGAVLYRTTDLFLKLFGLDSLKALPSVVEWDPSPEEQADLRDRLLRAGEQRAGDAASAG